MNLLRCTVIDGEGGISFIAHGEVLAALAKGCVANPQSLEELLEYSEPFYHTLREHVLNGLAIFDERNVKGRYEAIHKALEMCRPYEQPVFRIVDDLTREASLRPVKAGAVLFNLPARRIVQLQNSYREITRVGRGRVFDGERLTNDMFSYRLPKEWALVP